MQYQRDNHKMMIAFEANVNISFITHIQNTPYKSIVGRFNIDVEVVHVAKVYKSHLSCCYSQQDYTPYHTPPITTKMSPLGTSPELHAIAHRKHGQWMLEILRWCLTLCNMPSQSSTIIKGKRVLSRFQPTHFANVQNVQSISLEF